MLQKFFPLAYILMCLSLSAAEVENHFTRLSGGEKFPTFQRRKVHPIARLVRKEAPSKGFEASFRCAWDTAFLYLEVTVVDDRLIPADRALSWQNDVIEVYLDYTGKREKQNQFHWFPLLEKSRSPAFFSVADGRDLAAVGVRSETEKTPDGYIARLAIPLDFFLEEGGVRIQDGSVIGFDLCVNNLADPARNLIRHRFWSGDGSNWQSAAANGRMRFTGGKDCIAASGDGYRSSPADRYGLALWPELSLLTGNFRDIGAQLYGERVRGLDFDDVEAELVGRPQFADAQFERRLLQHELRVPGKLLVDAAENFDGFVIAEARGEQRGEVDLHVEAFGLFLDEGAENGFRLFRLADAHEVLRKPVADFEMVGLDGEKFAVIRVRRLPVLIENFVLRQQPPGRRLLRHERAEIAPQPPGMREVVRPDVAPAKPFPSRLHRRIAADGFFEVGDGFRPFAFLREHQPVIQDGGLRRHGDVHAARLLHDRLEFRQHFGLCLRVKRKPGFAGAGCQQGRRSKRTLKGDGCTGHGCRRFGGVCACRFGVQSGRRKSEGDR